MTDYFLHNVNLVFHEAGHWIFRPLGDTMTVFGGSLMQCLMPLAVMIQFLRQKDNLVPHLAYGGLDKIFWT